jgi:hypothetical protein
MDTRTELVTYFGLEKSWTTGLALFGAAALVLAIWLWLAKGPYRGAAVPLALFALVELGIGAGVALRTDQQAGELLQQLDGGNELSAERARMQGVLRTFEIVKLAELVLIAAGVGLTYALRSSNFAFSAGVGLIAQCSLLLLFDLIAERRAEPYFEALGGAARASAAPSP